MSLEWVEERGGEALVRAWSPNSPRQTYRTSYSTIANILAITIENNSHSEGNEIQIF